MRKNNTHNNQYEIVIKPNRSWLYIDWRGLLDYRDLLFILVRRDFVSSVMWRLDPLDMLKSDVRSIELNIKKLPLVPGRYRCTIYCTINNVVADWIQNATFFDVEAGDYYNSGKLPPSMGQGDFLMDYSYRIKI